VMFMEFCMVFFGCCDYEVLDGEEEVDMKTS